MCSIPHDYRHEIISYFTVLFMPYLYTTRLLSWQKYVKKAVPVDCFIVFTSDVVFSLNEEKIEQSFGYS